MVAIAIVLKLLSVLLRPRVAECPPDWIARGVRPHGETVCYLPTELGDGDRCTRSRVCGDGPEPLAELPMRVFCEPGEIAVVIADRRIACRVRRPTDVQWAVSGSE